MRPDALPPERALIRLRQLAREEQAAVAAGDVEALCRIADLLPALTESLQGAALEDGPLLREASAREAIGEAQVAHAAAEQYLTARMKEVREALKACAS